MNPNTYYQHLIDQIKDEIDNLMARASQEGSPSYANTLKINCQGMSDMLSFIRMNPPASEDEPLIEYMSRLNKITLEYRKLTKEQLAISQDESYARSWNSGARSAENLIGIVPAQKAAMNIFLGSNTKGDAVFSDIEKLPHLLIAGLSEKEISCFNTYILTSLLIENSPENLKIILMDSDKSELSRFDEIPHLSVPVIHNLKKAVSTMEWIISETERRMTLIKRSNAEDIHSFNIISTQKLPYVVIMLHDLADFMVTYPQKTEQFICQISENAHMAGVHLIASTCRPSVYVITGLIKKRIPARIAFQVPSQAESRIILDQTGAEDLHGKGDMLYFAPDAFQSTQIQGIQFSQENINQIINETNKTSQKFQDQE